MQAKRLYKQLKKFGTNLSTDALRKFGLAISNYHLLLPQNDKKFNYKRVKAINHFDKNSKKSDYGKSNLKRSWESDRMKSIRKRGTKALRRYLKKEAQNSVDDYVEICKTCMWYEDNYCRLHNKETFETSEGCNAYWD